MRETPQNSGEFASIWCKKGDVEIERDKEMELILVKSPLSPTIS
jgi:hypothetical protein